jgi:hypothetical protein
MKLFAPDYSLIALICGSFAAIWAFLRTGLILRALRKPQEPHSLFGQQGAGRGVIKF